VVLGFLKRWIKNKIKAIPCHFSKSGRMPGSPWGVFRERRQFKITTIIYKIYNFFETKHD